MSQLLARILLAFFVIPMGSVVYLISFFKCEKWIDRFTYNLSWQETYRYRVLLTTAITWAFVGGWWFLVWWKSVKWNAARFWLTAACAACAALAGWLIAWLIDDPWRGFGEFAGSISTPLLWLVGTIFIWRETSGERAARVDRSGRDSIVCPTCGYNLTGLKESRCPECGTQFTLDQLLASQPGRAQGEIEG